MKKIWTFEKTKEIALGASRIVLAEKTNETALAASKKTNVTALEDCRKIFVGCVRDLQQATT